MAELLSLIVKSLQAALGFAVLWFLISPLIAVVWPYIWPFLLLGLVLAVAEMLDQIEKRLERAKGKNR